MNFFIKHKLFFLLISVSIIACNTADQPEEEKEQQIEKKADDKFANESIYQLPSEWHTQDNDTISLSFFEGKYPIMAMVFTNCGYACPRMVADLQSIEEQIPSDLKKEIVFVLASFDTENDTPKRLKEYSLEHNLNENWILMHGNDEDVRLLSMLLDVQYKKQQDGNFAHSNKITLLDKNGQIIEQIDGLGKDPEPIISKLKEIHHY